MHPWCTLSLAFFSQFCITPSLLPSFYRLAKCTKMSPLCCHLIRMLSRRGSCRVSESSSQVFGHWTSQSVNYTQLIACSGSDSRFVLCSWPIKLTKTYPETSSAHKGKFQCQYQEWFSRKLHSGLRAICFWRVFAVCNGRILVWVFSVYLGVCWVIQVILVVIVVS